MNKFVSGLFASVGLLLSTNLAFAVENTSLDGTITIEYEDFENHSQLRYWLTDRDNNRKELALKKAPGWLKSGQKIRVTG